MILKVRETFGFENNKICTKYEIVKETILGTEYSIGLSLYDTKEEAEYHIRIME